MVIGIDASRAFGSERTGTENYSCHVITQMLGLIESREHQFVLFVRPKTKVPAEIKLSNVQIVEIKLPYLWTQLGLAAATWSKRELDVLWIPAHTLPILRRPGLPTVVTIHGLEYEWLPEYRNWLQRWYLPLSTMYAVKSASRLIAVSHFTKNQLVKRLKAVSKHIKVIHEGVELGLSEIRKTGRSASQKDQLAGLSARMKVLNKWKLRDKGYILFVGTIQPRKNLAFLITAYAQISPAVRKQTKLVIAGSQGWMSEDVYATPGKLGIADSVVLTGRVSEAELAALYSGALVYVQPSVTEGFGLPVLEAMANGVPVISSDGGALAEVVGEAGMVLPVSDLLAWKVGLTKVLSQPRLRERMAAAGRWRVREFSWAKAAATTLQYLTK